MVDFTFSHAILLIIDGDLYFFSPNVLSSLRYQDFMNIYYSVPYDCSQSQGSSIPSQNKTSRNVLCILQRIKRLKKFLNILKLRHLFYVLYENRNTVQLYLTFNKHVIKILFKKKKCLAASLHKMTCLVKILSPNMSW